MVCGILCLCDLATAVQRSKAKCAAVDASTMIGKESLKASKTTRIQQHQDLARTYSGPHSKAPGMQGSLLRFLVCLVSVQPVQHSKQDLLDPMQPEISHTAGQLAAGAHRPPEKDHVLPRSDSGFAQDGWMVQKNGEARAKARSCASNWSRSLGSKQMPPVAGMRLQMMPFSAFLPASRQTSQGREPR